MKKNWISRCMGVLWSLMMMVPGGTMGEGFILPEALTSVEEEAFSGVEATEVTMPAGLEASVTEVFPAAPETLWVHYPQGDAARTALFSGLDVDAETVRRALVIGQTYPSAGADALIGPTYDAAAIKGMLTHLDRARFQVSVRKNLTASGILSAIQGTFAGATEYDISLFYYSGHGRSGGRLVGCEDGVLSGAVTPAQLRSAMDQIPGRKVIIVDACYSGGVIDQESWDREKSRESGSLAPADNNGLNGEGSLLTASLSGEGEEGEEKEKSPESAQGTMIPDPSEFTGDFLSAFGPAPSGKNTKGTVRTGSYSAYYIMTAASAEEESWEGTISQGEESVELGLFTYALCRGCGWNGVSGASAEKRADANGDGLVTFGEAFAYAAARAKAMAANGGKVQNAQSNAGDLQSFSPFR